MKRGKGIKCVTTTIYGLELIEYRWVKRKGAYVLRMVRENGKILKQEELK